jgi:DNA-binding NarL/FixJ family response regulator
MAAPSRYAIPTRIVAARDVSTVGTRGDLIAEELEIARLPCDGLSNPEIGAQLFISPRTVQFHPHKVFGKLGISSRVQLEDAID